MNVNIVLKYRKSKVILLILFFSVIMTSSAKVTSVRTNRTSLSIANTQIGEEQKYYYISILDCGEVTPDIEDSKHKESIENTLPKEEKIEVKENNEVKENTYKEEKISSTEDKKDTSKDVKNNTEEYGNNNNVRVSVEDAYVKDGKKSVYLTFDDGPSSNTPKILDILEKNSIKATFFAIGDLAESYPNTIMRIVKEGHSLGNHSYSHNYKQLYASKESFTNELTKADQVYKQILGGDFSTHPFRFPAGSFEKSKQPLKESLKEFGYRYIDWNALNGDTEVQNPTAEWLLKRIKESSVEQEKLVVLMHDAEAKYTTVEALESIINYYKTQGFEFKSLK